MVNTTLHVDGIDLPLIVLDTVVIGTGCAGFNAADWLYTFGRTDIAILTEGVNRGTSRNTGSDKQTYYKLSLASDGLDSVAAMASDLFAGGGVNGDIALAEAAGSVRSFMKLCNLGVPFPVNEYGEYIGYKTDHDPRQQATSVGPLTSKIMTECLEQAVRDKDIPILDGMTVIRLLVSDDGVEGLLCLNHEGLERPGMGLTVVRARQVVLATGGPAGCYLNSVYPESQTGMSGMALEAGAEGANLQEWQYGLASLQFRWNVSGTYQQVLPRYISVDADGNEREFLLDYFLDPFEAMDMVFLKGYQWPFDTAKISGSSRIDILVHREMAVLGRQVFMDFRRNPSGLEKGFDKLGDETRQYLERSGALLGTPIERLEIMNRPAIDLYRAHDIDLYTQPLEIGVCAQHHNGGIAVDSHWQSTIRGLYIAGEAAGTFGVYRPGGSALNSAQVGSLRAAEHIACTTRSETDVPDSFMHLATREAAEATKLLEGLIRPCNASTLEEECRKVRASMSRSAGHLRDPEGMEELERRIAALLSTFTDRVMIDTPKKLPSAIQLRDTLVTQLAVLSAMRTAAQMVGSRGAGLVITADRDDENTDLPISYQPVKPNPENRQMVTQRTKDGFVSAFKPVRPLPQPDGWFETVWNDYRRRMAQIFEGDR